MATKKKSELKKKSIIKVKSDFLEKKKEKELYLTEERVKANIPEFTKLVSFWREYPDMFIDMIKGEDSKFEFFFYQRVFLRAAMRHRYFFGTFTRAFSKSFLAVLLNMIKCILYPGIKVFITSGGKEQAAGIAKEKVLELCDLIPPLKKEIDWRPGKTLFGKDYVEVLFKNGSRFDVVAAKESSRGGRRHSGLIDEVILVDGEKFSQVILPMMNVSRRAACGQVDPNDKMNKSQIYITSAGFKDHFSYHKQIQLLVWQAVKPEKAMVIGGSWRTPVYMGLLDRGFVNDLKSDGTFNEVSFAREYESVWAGTSEEAFFNGDNFDKYRELNDPEFSSSGRGNGKHYYVFGVDVGRNGCQTVITVWKVNPQKNGVGIKSLVNIITYDSEHFELQALEIKRQYLKYYPKYIAIDGNGVGFGLVDFLTIPSTDRESGEEYPAFGVANDEKRIYSKIDTGGNVIKDVLWIVKANTEINSEGYTNIVTQMGSGKLRFLLEERIAKNKLLDTKRGKTLSVEQRVDELKPYVLTSILKEELLNLAQKPDSKHFDLMRINKSIQKDKVSAMMYGLYVIKQIEDKERRRKRGSVTDMMFFG